MKGQLLICGATNWDLIGRKEVPKQQGTMWTKCSGTSPFIFSFHSLLFTNNNNDSVLKLLLDQFSDTVSELSFCW